MTRNAFLDRIFDHVLIADGAMGTYLNERGVPWEQSFEDLNRTSPEIVRSVHEEYVAVGCQLLETNTFQANRISLGRKGLEEHVAAINTAGVGLARTAAGGNTLVAGSMGPLPRVATDEELSPDDIAEVYREQASLLADAGADALILETFTDLDMLVAASMAARKVCDLPIIAEMAFTALGGAGGDDAVRALMALEAHGADVVGGNCGSGPTGLVKFIEAMGHASEVAISAVPNASYPQYVDGRYVFSSSVEYLAERAEELVAAGANIVGGCCGTTPAHLKLIADRLAHRAPAKRVIAPRPAPRAQLYERVERRPPSFLDDVGKRTLILAELDPPKGLDYAGILDGARALKLAGVDAITSADNSLATIRLSTFVMSHLIQREVGLPVVTHCACRDRNLIGQQSELMGASVLGIRTVLALTGDPASMANIGASSVYDTNSIGLIKLIKRLNAGENLAGASIGRPTEFVVGCALDPGGAKLDGQIKRLERKIAAGADFCMTQPLYDHDRIRELYERVKPMGIPVFVGIMPLISRRNAEFLHNEVPGIRIPDEVIERMRAVEPHRAGDVGISIAAELIQTALDAGAPGIYIIPPFSRYELVLKLAPIIKQWDRSKRTAASSGS